MSREEFANKYRIEVYHEVSRIGRLEKPDKIGFNGGYNHQEALTRVDIFDVNTLETVYTTEIKEDDEIFDIIKWRFNVDI